MPDGRSRCVGPGGLAAHHAYRQANRFLAVWRWLRATQRGVDCPCSCMTVAIISASCSCYAWTRGRSSINSFSRYVGLSRTRNITI
jgi:hypothetical protein